MPTSEFWNPFSSEPWGSCWVGGLTGQPFRVVVLLVGCGKGSRWKAPELAQVKDDEGLISTVARGENSSTLHRNKEVRKLRR